MHKLFEIPSITLFLCVFCAFLRLTRTVFSRLLKKAISMALWTMASLCAKSSLLEQSLPRTPSRPIRSLPTYQVGPCNPWLIKDLRENKALYICREFSTSVESSLQIKLFMQNKANFPKSQMNVNNVSTRDYEKRTLGGVGKTNPIQTQYKANSNPIKAKTNPIQSQTNPISELNIVNSLMIILLYCIPAYFIRKSRIWKNTE